VQRSASKAGPIVLVTTRLFDDEAEAILVRGGCVVRRSGLPEGELDSTISDTRMHELLQDADGWIVGVFPVTRALLQAFPALKVISRRGVGYDTVDIAAANDLGRTVTIAVGGNEPSVADHAAALILALGRRLCESTCLLRTGQWETLLASELRGKTLGLIGLGQIARGVAERLRAFGPRIVAADPSADAQEWASAKGVEIVQLAELLVVSDAISLHIPLLSSTRHVIDRAALATVKPTAILVNTARGGLVDDRALLDALRGGRLAGAALDVFESEADAALMSVTKDLLACPNFIGTAHAAGSSVEGLARANLIAAENVLAVFRGEQPPSHRVVTHAGQPAPHI
jgi:D-3-phosphoglycerate dehydrogenase